MVTVEDLNKLIPTIVKGVLRLAQIGERFEDGSVSWEGDNCYRYDDGGHWLIKVNYCCSAIFDYDYEEKSIIYRNPKGSVTDIEASYYDEWENKVYWFKGNDLLTMWNAINDELADLDY